MFVHGEGFVKVASVKILDTSEAVWLGLKMSPFNCELVYRRNSSCSAYASLAITGKGTSCLARYGELMNTVINMDEGFDIHVCVDAHKLGHNLWGLIDGATITPPTDDKEKRAWMIKAGKAMFALKTSMEDDLLKHIKDAKSLKEIWDTYVALFMRRNDARL
ncbi:hypothetical protein GH714_001041 [Hevea brasiliensis]|uniref:Apple domain-containing protein n=1 Tax=Hevea brasiliensis TaxID=3981 RepID=A0A6A6M7D1_HEVBR|nr:hypothetical protein GH714_001041 [Hevea brasiliensis]